MEREPDRNPRKALGKGLSALLPSRPPSPGANVTAPSVPNGSVEPRPAKNALPEHFEDFQSLPLAQIRPGPEQPRSLFDEEKLKELADSIRANGLIQPITVYKEGGGTFSIIAGERRWRAAKIAGLTEIPALVRSPEQQRSLELGLIENIQREDLNAIEIAAAFDRLVKDHGLSHDQIAERTGKDRSTVTNYIRLLKLSSFVRDRLSKGGITMGHARALLNIPNPDLQDLLCGDIEARQLSVRQAEQLTKQWTNARPEAKEAATKHDDKEDPNVRAAVDEMSAALGTKVRLTRRSETSGTIEIEYYSREDLDRIYSVITGNN